LALRGHQRRDQQGGHYGEQAKGIDAAEHRALTALRAHRTSPAEIIDRILSRNTDLRFR
jgi:hypothetical protein